MRHLSFRSLPALAITSLLGTTALAQDYAAFVLDRSGSMASTRSGSSNTRAADSVAIALSDAFWYFLFHPTSQVLVYEFHGTTVTQIGGVHTTLAGVTAAINAVPGPGGNTPLAVALCQATSDLYDLNTAADASSRTLYLYSDGGENSSPTSSCRGTLPTSTSGNHCSQQGSSGAYDSGSWQQAICNIIHGKITSNFYYFDSFADDADPFVQAICDLTGGTLTRIPDASTMPMVNPWRTSGVGCRDFHNTVLSMTHTGLPELGETVQIGCRTSSPLPYILGVGLSNTNSNMGPLPLDLAPLGAPGCRIYSSWDVMDGFLPWNGERNVALPNSTAFRGMTLYYQGAQLHPLNNAFGVAFSNLLHMTII